MTSEAYVWRWHPCEAEPMLCARLYFDGAALKFVYGRNYRESGKALALSPHMPVDAAEHILRAAHIIPRPLADAGPDNWGRRVIEYRAPNTRLNELDFLLSGGGDRVGAFEFTPSIQPPPPPNSQSSYAQLQQAADLLERDDPLSPELEEALQHGTSIGGARPKATVTDGARSLIVKLSSTTDRDPIVRLELAGMRLAHLCSIDVPPLDIIEIDGQDALLIERFDRVENDAQVYRRQMLSALSLLNLDEDEHRAASYPDLAEALRRWGSIADSQQLFRRMVFNILIGNTDDHAKNHAAFWDGKLVNLTPAYDIVPLPRVSQESNQAMAVGEFGHESTLRNAWSQARAFGYTPAEARTVTEDLISTIQAHWQAVFAENGISERVMKRCCGTTILSPAALRAT